MKLSRQCKVKSAGWFLGSRIRPGSRWPIWKRTYGVIYDIFCLSASIVWHTNGINTFTLMPPDPTKIQALRSSGTLNPRPEKVCHPRFADSEFFDPHDLVQVKYETLRAVETDSRPLAQAAVDFGLSRPTVYQARQAFQTAGLEGLFPHKRGPKSPHKLKPEVRQYLEEALASSPELKADELAQQVRRRFGVQVHPRTIEKALRKAKRGRQVPPPNQR